MSALISIKQVVKGYVRGRQRPTRQRRDHGGGAADRQAFLGPAREVARAARRKTIVMVTHDPRAADHASRRLYVDKGSLVETPALAPT